MRFAIMVLVAVATGALSMTAVQTTAVQTWFPSTGSSSWLPSNAPMFEAVRALGGSMAGFKLADINPVKAYHDAMRRVTSGDMSGVPRFDTKFGTQVPYLKVTTPLFGSSNQFKMDPSVQRAIASGFNARIGQDIRRAQDIAAYGRNPMAWHGPPPH
jgi:hypothetical protein